MHIRELISQANVIGTLASQEKEDVLREIAGKFAENLGVELEPIFSILAKREELASTAIGGGIAIPHGKFAGVDQVVGLLARSPEGVDFDSLDGKPTHLFVALLAPEKGDGAHLKALARITRLFRNASFRSRMNEAKSEAEMFQLMVDEDGK